MLKGRGINNQSLDILRMRYRESIQSGRDQIVALISIFFHDSSVNSPYNTQYTHIRTTAVTCD